MSNLIGVDIGGTKCAVILGEYTEQEGISIIDKVSFLTEVKKGPQSALDKITDSIEGILENSGRNPGSIFGIGISCGGQLDSKRGIIMSPPNLIGGDNIQITSILEKRFGIRTCIQNDANACALAE